MDYNKKTEVELRKLIEKKIKKLKKRDLINILENQLTESRQITSLPRISQNRPTKNELTLNLIKKSKDKSEKFKFSAAVVLKNIELYVKSIKNKEDLLKIPPFQKVNGILKRGSFFHKKPEYKLLNEFTKFIKKRLNVVIHTRFEGFEKILESKKFKSIYEIPEIIKNRGDDYISSRNKAEKNMFGYDKNYSPESRPKYGCVNLFNKKTGCATRYYGDIVFHLDTKKLLNRITFTPQDTITFPSNYFGTFDYLNFFIYKSYMRRFPKFYYLFLNFYLKKSIDYPFETTANEIDDYFEAQIHGEVKLSDIKYVYYNKNSKNANDIKKLCKKHNITCKTYDKEYEFIKW